MVPNSTGHRPEFTLICNISNDIKNELLTYMRLWVCLLSSSMIPRKETIARPDLYVQRNVFQDYGEIGDFPG